MKQPIFEFGQTVKVKNVSERIVFEVTSISKTNFNGYWYNRGIVGINAASAFPESDLELCAEPKPKRVLKPFFVKDSDGYILRYYLKDCGPNPEFCFPAIGIPDQSVEGC